MEINGIQIFDIKAFLENYWPDQSKWPTDAVRCPRCLGSGRYSFNPRDMDRCFWCSIDGTYRGYILPGHKHYDWVKESKRYQVRGMRCNFTTDDENQIVPFLKKAAQIANQHWDDRFDMSIKAIDWQTDHHVFYERVDGKWTKCFDSNGPRPDPEPEPEHLCAGCQKPTDHAINGQWVCKSCWIDSMTNIEELEQEVQEGRYDEPWDFCPGCEQPISGLYKGTRLCSSCWHEENDPPPPIQEKKEDTMESKMFFTGVINSEETMRGDLSNGTCVYVELATHIQAPEHLRDDPEYWLVRIERGDFHDEENPPVAWIEADEKPKPQVSPEPTGYTCKCGKPVYRPIEGEMICQDCWDLSQMSAEDIEHAKQVERMLTHCNSDDCDAPLITVIEKREKFCQSCLDEMEMEMATFPKCEDCGFPVNDKGSKYCNNCHMKRGEKEVQARLAEVKRQIKMLDAKEQRIIAAEPNHRQSLCKRGTCKSCEEWLQIEYSRHELYKEMDRLEHKLEMFG